MAFMKNSVQARSANDGIDGINKNKEKLKDSFKLNDNFMKNSLQAS